MIIKSFCECSTWRKFFLLWIFLPRRQPRICGLNAEDVFDKCDTSRDVAKDVAQEMVEREEFDSVDDVRIELGASSDSAKSLGSGKNSNRKRLLNRVASTSSPKDVGDVADILQDSTVLKGLKDAITRGDAQLIQAIVHKLRGWAMSLQAHDLVPRQRVRSLPG